MLERLHFLVVYVGSAALVAFLAVCVTSPRVAVFACGTSDASGAEQCELAATLAAVAPELGDSHLESAASDASSPVQVASARP
ncbi:MAG TPA: hypothetical protein VGM74_07380 [Burkholderiaceae bacterium]|jgi:hypothetical protein